ncbi:HK97 gp10 family phage protein [Gallintestinimicrobium sp.]|uniref:HK97 gp10 family phage protein n=1 Tax=Gallintestinimicrobium sp. TaxID=2981655 RepID=UPI00399BA264
MPESEAVTWREVYLSAPSRMPLWTPCGNTALLAADEMKEAVRAAGNTVRDEIRENAPKDTGTYAKSWTVKSRGKPLLPCPLPYIPGTVTKLAHLLEFGHAKRGGGRVSAKPHIARRGSQAGIRQLEEDIRKALEG